MFECGKRDKHGACKDSCSSSGRSPVQHCHCIAHIKLLARGAANAVPLTGSFLKKTSPLLHVVSFPQGQTLKLIQSHSEHLLEVFGRQMSLANRERQKSADGFRIIGLVTISGFLCRGSRWFLQSLLKIPIQ